MEQEEIQTLEFSCAAIFKFAPNKPTKKAGSTEFGSQLLE